MQYGVSDVTNGLWVRNLKSPPYLHIPRRKKTFRQTRNLFDRSRRPAIGVLVSNIDLKTVFITRKIKWILMVLQPNVPVKS